MRQATMGWLAVCGWACSVGAVQAQIVYGAVNISATVPNAASNVEPAIIASPTNSGEFVVAWRRPGVNPAPNLVFWCTSADGGVTFSTPQPVLSPPTSPTGCPSTFTSDPMVAASRLDGSLYVGCLLSSTFVVGRKAAGSSVLTNLNDIVPCGQSVDKGFLAIGPAVSVDDETM